MGGKRITCDTPGCGEFVSTADLTEKPTSDVAAVASLVMYAQAYGWYIAYDHVTTTRQCYCPKHGKGK